MAEQRGTDGYVAREVALRRSYQHLAQDAAAMTPYTSLHIAAVEQGALSTKIKEIMAVSIAIVLQCEGCILYHMRNALGAGASEQELFEAANVAIMMGGGPAVVYAARLQEMVEEFQTSAQMQEKINRD